MNILRDIQKLRSRYDRYVRLGVANLALAGVVGVVGSAHAADTASMITRMERDMRAMQEQIQQLKQKQEIENRRVRAQLERQRILLEANPYALHDRMVESDDLSELAGLGVGDIRPLPGSSINQQNTDILGIELAKLAKPRVGDTPFAELTSTPPAHPDLYGPLRRGQLQIGDARITLGGFFEAAGAWRSVTTGSDMYTPFASLPMQNSDFAHMSSMHESSRASRLSVLIEGMITKELEADAYIETDLGASGSSANSRGTNGYSLRARVVYGELKDFKHGWYILGGQNWSLLTLSHYGMFARNEEVPLTIDQGYMPGFTYTRGAQLRILKMFDNNKFGVGLSVESPSSSLQNGNACFSGDNSGTTTCHKGTGINNPDTYYATDNAPDVIGKVTADPSWGHFEVSGVMRFFHDRSRLGKSYSRNHTRIGGGVGGGFILPFFNNKFHIRASGIVGSGIGRYGASGLADYTVGRNGEPDVLPEASFMFGAYGRPHPKLQLYAYAGMDRVLSREYSGSMGYGNPNFNMSGCQTPGAGAATCQAGENMHWIGEVTGGFWYTAFKGDYGTVLTGAQYGYVQASSFSGIGGKGHTDANLVFFSLRYLPFS